MSGKESSPLKIDSTSETRRQIYLVAFPVGAAFVAAYVTLAWEKLTFSSIFIAICVAAVLLFFTGFLFFSPRTLSNIEVSFYFFMVLFFPLFGGFNLNSPQVILYGSSDYVSEVINGLMMWEVIFFVGAFLAIPHKTFQFLMTLLFILLFTMAAINIRLLLQAGQSPQTNLFHWLHGFFALSITLILIWRIGRVQQIYATTDPLTGLLNRRAGTDILSHEYDRAYRYNTDFSLILFDIDHFKMVNDAHGHTTGDLVLKHLSDLLSNTVRKTDSIVRWGGEEFLIILPCLGPEEARLTAERLNQGIKQAEFDKAGHITVSMGVTAYQSGLTMEKMLVHADKALYQAKHQGRNQVVVYAEAV